MKKLFGALLVTGFMGITFCVQRLDAAGTSREDLMFMDIPVVITATLTEKSLEKTPASVTVITQKEIQESGAKDLMDVLSRVNGMMYYYSFFTGPATASLRGVAGYGKIKLLINGHSLDSGMWNHSLYTNAGIENVKQIEIVRGPGSALYGTNAFAGVINIITYTGKDKEGLFIDGKYGQYMDRANAYYGRSYSNGAVSINAHRYNYDRTGIYFEKDKFSGTTFSQAPGNAEEINRDIDVQVDASYKNLSIELHGVNDVRRFPVTEMGALTDEGEKADNRLFSAEAKHTATLLPSLLLKTKLSYDYVDFANFGTLMPKNFTLGADVNGDGLFDAWPDGVYADYGYRSDQLKSEAVLDYSLSGNNELLVGAFYEYTRTRDIYFKSNSNPVAFFMYPEVTDLSEDFNWNKAAQRRTYGLFFQDEWNISSEWYLLLGSRYDYYNDVGGSFNPRCGIVWSAAPHLTAKLMYNSAFRAPSFADLYNQNNPVLVGNTDLKPETMESYELALSHIWASRVFSDLSLYSSRIDNMLAPSTSDPTNPLAPLYLINRNRSRIWGVDLTEKYVFSKDNYVFASYSHVQAKDDILNTYLPDVPRNQVSCGFNVLLPGSVGVNVSANHTSEIARASWDTQDPLPSYTLLNTVVRCTVVKDLTLTCGVYNLLDTKYYYPPINDLAPLSDQVQQGINVMGGLSYKF